MLEIRAPKIFAHAGCPSPQFAPEDPRDPDFEEDSVRIDLSDCEFVHPPAALWCAVYGALVCHHGRACELVVPENIEAASYLKATGLYSTLALAGVDVDERGVGAADESQVVLPLSQFAAASEVEDLVDETIERLSERGFSGSFGAIASNAFGELGINAVQHSESPIDAYGMAHFYDNPQHGKQFSCAVADGGIGIRESLHQNRAVAPLSDDETAIDYAVWENISGTGSPSRGMGLFGIADATRKFPNRGLIIHSGVGMLMLGADAQGSRPPRIRARFPGTLAAARISA